MSPIQSHFHRLLFSFLLISCFSPPLRQILFSFPFHPPSLSLSLASHSSPPLFLIAHCSVSFFTFSVLLPTALPSPSPPPYLPSLLLSLLPSFPLHLSLPLLPSFPLSLPLPTTYPPLHSSPSYPPFPTIPPLTLLPSYPPSLCLFPSPPHTPPFSFPFPQRSRGQPPRSLEDFRKR